MNEEILVVEERYMFDFFIFDSRFEIIVKNVLLWNIIAKPEYCWLT